MKNATAQDLVRNATSPTRLQPSWCSTNTIRHELKRDKNVEIKDAETEMSTSSNQPFSY